MRFIFFALLSVLAVVFTTSTARAESESASNGRCLIPWGSFEDVSSLTLPSVSPAFASASRSSLPSTTVAPRLAASLIETVVKPSQRPGQSEAPRLCLDADQPDCQVQSSDSPSRGGHFIARHELMALLNGHDDIAPPEENLYDFALPRRQSRSDGFIRRAWRPPAHLRAV